MSGGTQGPVGSPCGFAYGALTLSRRPSQAVPLPRGFVTARRPALQPRRGRSARRFGLFPVRSPLLGESRLISLPLGTEMFQFPRLPPPRLCVRRGVPGLWSRRVRPFGDPRVWRACAPNRGLSQLVTSFVGFLCQGIHRVRLPSSLRWLVRTHTLRPGPSPPARSDAIFLKKENFSSLSRYAALRVRRGRALGTGHCAPGAARGKPQRGRAGSPAPHRPRGGVLPRKEVIQPHLPVRLPCYDFTPLTLHTFGASPPRGLGRRLRVQTTRVV